MVMSRNVSQPRVHVLCDYVRILAIMDCVLGSFVDQSDSISLDYFFGGGFFPVERIHMSIRRGRQRQTDTDTKEILLEENRF